MPTLTIELPLHSVTTVKQAMFYLTETAEVEDDMLLGVRKLDAIDGVRRTLYAITFTETGAYYFADWLNHTVDSLEQTYNGEWSR
jgi:hypothetical protein